MEFDKDDIQRNATMLAIIQSQLIMLDVDLLDDALKKFRENHSYREAAAILDPSPFTHSERQDLNAAKNEQLRLIIALRRNLEKIGELERSLVVAEENKSKLAGIFSL